MLTSLAAVPAISRQRAVAKSPASASACAAVHTTTSYAVSACVEPPVVLDAPASVITGASFDLSVDRQPGAVALWTIVNGTPSTATGESVTITAGSSGNVDVRVQLTRGACTGQLDRSIAITPKPPCTNPKASVSAGPVGCGSAIVNASFTGTPPFHGFWSDGVPFTTSKMAMARTVTMTGNFSIVNFEDATCAGTSSGVAVLPALGPSATVVAKPNSCVGVDNLTVLFTGKPPFSGIWFNNTTFSTNEMQMVWPAALDLNELMDGRDGTGCRFMLFGGVSQGHETPRTHLEMNCMPPEYGNLVEIRPIGSFKQPLSVTWADGVTSSYVYRDVTNSPQQATTYTIASMHDAYCEAILEAPLSITVYASPAPVFQEPSVGEMCNGQIGTIALAVPPPPEADSQVTWQIDNGLPVSGQGYTLQFQTGRTGTSTVVTCIFTFPGIGRCPTSKRRNWYLGNLAPHGTLSSAKAQIHAGETVDLTFTIDSNAQSWTVSNSLNDATALVGPCNNNFQPCHMSYRSTHGAGQSTITLHMNGFCSNPGDASTVLTILP
jgi:hypothetical protein